ncbi:hypothetical protein FRC06_001362 [Ceratobasidium sp. 370]|nr:hypothetical protein FRC06_001362 [Ceratobasidium sp. 370]
MSQVGMPKPFLGIPPSFPYELFERYLGWGDDRTISILVSQPLFFCALKSIRIRVQVSVDIQTDMPANSEASGGYNFQADGSSSSREASEGQPENTQTDTSSGSEVDSQEELEGAREGHRGEPSAENPNLSFTGPSSLNSKLAVLDTPFLYAAILREVDRPPRESADPAVLHTVDTQYSSMPNTDPDALLRFLLYPRRALAFTLDQSDSDHLVSEIKFPTDFFQPPLCPGDRIALGFGPGPAGVSISDVSVGVTGTWKRLPVRVRSFM